LSGSLRHQLFFSSALLCSAILVFAAWVINFQVVRKARTQVLAEVGTLLPLYDAVLNERARRLATLSSTMAGSPILKAVFGAARVVGQTQQPMQTFAMLKDGLFQLALTPVLLQAGGVSSHNTLGVFGNGFELDRAFAWEIKHRIQGDLIFFVGSRIYLSSLVP